MPNLKCIVPSTYKSNTYTYLDVASSSTQTANTCMHTCTHTITHSHTNTHLDTHRHLRAGGLKKVSKNRKVFWEDLKELTEDA